MSARTHRGTALGGPSRAQAAASAPLNLVSVIGEASGRDALAPLVVQSSDEILGGFGYCSRGGKQAPLLPLARNA